MFNKHFKGFNSWTQLVSMLFCQFAKSQSMRDIRNGLRAGETLSLDSTSILEQVADELAGEGVSVEVIDPRTTSPLDRETILDSVDKTGRLVVVDEANPFCGMASEIAALVACEALECLEAPVQKVTAPHTPVPATPALEQAYVPSPAKIKEAIHTAVSS